MSETNNNTNTPAKMLPIDLIEENEGQLSGLPENPRDIAPERMELLKADIQKYPQFLRYNALKVYPLENGKYIVIGGNQRCKALRELGYKEVPCVVFPKETSIEELKAYIILDNSNFGRWDWTKLTSEEWDSAQLESWGVDMLGDWDTKSSTDSGYKGKDNDSKEEQNLLLTDRFIVPPFSILDTRKGYWQERKKIWKDLIGDNGDSRNDLLLSSPEVKYKDLYLKTKKHRKELGISFREYLEKYVSDEEKEKSKSKTLAAGVSILDPVMAEIVCKWFGLENCKTFDCFAGDSVFGFVSSYLGNEFTGIELRPQQAALNNSRVEGMNAHYINDDGQNVEEHIAPSSQDLLFSCPPYFDIEVYSDFPNDASNQDSYEDFISILRNAFTSAIKCLKNDRFAIIVVGDVRNKKTGCYYDFCGDIKHIFRDNGAELYNELILIESGASTALRAGKYMDSRKVAKMHQNVLVFYKGDTKNIKINFPKIEYASEDMESFRMDSGDESN